MRCDDRDNTKKLRGFIPIVVLLKKLKKYVTGFSDFLKKPFKSL